MCHQERWGAVVGGAAGLFGAGRSVVRGVEVPAVVGGAVGFVALSAPAMAGARTPV